MNKQECKIVQDLLPLYIDNLVEEDTKLYIEQHLEVCDECNDIQRRMREGVSVQILNKGNGAEKNIIKYIAKIMIWYMLCPLGVIFLIVLGGGTALRIYEGVLILIALSCIGSEVFYKSTWWDPECIKLQEEIKKEEKKKRGEYYVRPILIGLPAILTILVLNIPRITHYVSMMM